ncbi:DUF4349 domain-containing protein [Alkalihalobacterium alkalinitrilicum]|uniref:DUF4349 domain-containing protein n=1 Tax=Alkalihalobacterium alkalinitrilicum TaxID=427920 RepID=UPI00099594C4|nr:DUF4349 domain-containing protein [Alkalihalobacterium alkalinitrilicum]
MQNLRKRSFIIVAIMILGLFLTACSSNEHRSDGSEEAREMGMVTEDASYGGVASRGIVEEKEMVNEVPVSDEPVSVETSERMVIYHGNLSLEVTDYHESEAEIQKRVNELGGFVLESSIYRSGEQQIHGNLVVKVPQAYFQSFMNEVETNSVRVHERYVSGNDVTEEYVDLESRLRSKRVVEKRLLGFMEEATNTEDLLKISSDLGKVQEEIETFLGRINYIEKNVEFSTITIHLQENKVNVPSIQGSQDLNTWDKSKSLFMASINNTMAIFSGLIVLFIGLSPIIIPMALIALVIVYKLRKRKKDIETL